LTISGINLTAITQIKFQGVAAVTTGFTNNTDKSVTVVVPAGATTGKITVSTASGMSVLSAQTFTVGVATPVIAATGLSATSGQIGSLLTITGTNLAGITAIQFQGAAALTTGFINNSATAVTVTVPADAAIGKITVTTAAGGTSALSTQTFTVIIPAPTIASTGLSATSGPEGSLLTITGTNLSGITQIKFSGATAVISGFTNNTATSVTVTVPVGAITGKITVTTAGGTSAASTQTFRITVAAATRNATLQNVEIYPNPFEEIVTIDLNGSAQITDIKIVSLTGEVLKQIQLNGFSTRIDTQFLATGVYIVYISNNEGEQATYRMVKK
ncbi:MAG TPA: T9SS type A sorting domain-containing protein, partial [Cytophaga sp.]|nr:T9SS type A sorting domain-containing protein [Cytophaga sp.]